MNGLINLDPQTVIPPANEVFPFFQPILSLQTQQVFGYETLGRRVSGESVQSLGPFFQNEQFSNKHLPVDRMIREQAIRKWAEMSVDAKLFLNLKPSWIYRKYRQNRGLPTLRMLNEYGLDPSKIVIEVTEDEFFGQPEELSAMTSLYREAGCLIAVDDIGSGFSNYDRIASIRPNLLKVDLKLLKRAVVDQGYDALLNSFSILAEQMGASLLIEGVETKEDLNHSMKVGARYVQGFLFSPARHELQAENAYEGMLREHLAAYTRCELDRYHKLYEVTESLEAIIPSNKEVRTPEEADALIGRVVPYVAENVVRMYICKEEGFQISSNFTRGDEGWHSDPGYRGSNWIWRPYFIPTVLQMKHQRQGCLSRIYADLDESKPMQTYSCPIGRNHYLFLDLII